MNANELADLLDAVEEPDIRRAVAMLRQQQAEIEALEASKDRLIKTLLDVRGQQPVAYVNKYADGKETLDNGTDLTAEDSIPLYTHPVKELTDEEIIEVRKTTRTNDTSNWADTLAFARAILRKAQE